MQHIAPEGRAVSAPDTRTRTRTHARDELPTRPAIPAAMAFFTRIPVVIGSLRASLDPRAASVVAWIDGRRTVDAVLHACALSTDDALAALEELRMRGIITLH